MAEGYAEREIALTLTVTPLGATAASTDVVNLTVTPVLQTLTVTRSQNFAANPPWYVVPSYAKLGAGNFWLISNGSGGIANNNVPAFTPAVNMSATALNTNISGQLSFIQNGAILNNLKTNTVGAIMDTTNMAGVFAAPNAGATLIDCFATAQIPYYINTAAGAHTLTTANGAQTVADQDTPKVPITNIMPAVMQKNPTQVDFTQQFTLYAVWQYSDGTYWPLGNVAWNVRYAGQITTGANAVFNANANNAVNSSSPLARSNALPAAALTVSGNPTPPQTPILNNAGAGWVMVPGG